MIRRLIEASPCRWEFEERLWAGFDAFVTNRERARRERDWALRFRDSPGPRSVPTVILEKAELKLVNLTADMTRNREGFELNIESTWKPTWKPRKICPTCGARAEVRFSCLCPEPARG